ncbi:hypothetical protein P3T76_010019 [Phytophthora citrophthora]|uniref:Uncharacterized protein n=1 Tax=Phytophthora citrophthora TaxID=4793 RepID=A0AAD9GDU3_9STRA|nr:hypothetical protein P3T76_010019 [Phytophthora citrophthora]
MKTHDKSKSYKASCASNTYQRRKSYIIKESTEWDQRIDVIGPVNAASIVKNVKSNKDSLLYAMVSGVEHPDKEAAGVHRSNEKHVHAGIIATTPINRAAALGMICENWK